MVRRSCGGVSAKEAPILRATLLLIREIVCTAQLSKEYDFLLQTFVNSSTLAPRDGSLGQQTELNSN
jgi:hypothetical protein